uniref:G-protein coupled receptors family 1 profile domain-containing protein n=1 Tax=Anopheles dirus TaxID=7168 RepID=A0A182NQX7_9DIPT
MAAFVEPHFDAWTQGSGNMTVVDKVPPEMLHMVHPHWNQFPPMNPLWHSILGFAIFMLGMISMTGNGCVMYIFTNTNPLATIWGSLFAKANAVYNPIVYGISHPKYRAALYQKFPSLSCQDAPADDGQSVASGATQASDEKA